MITLTLQRQGTPPQVLRFGGATTFGIGRSPGNAVHIPDSRVSGLHGQILQRGDAWAYRDLRSTNGSLRLRGESRAVVDGEATPEVSLEDGDLLLLGDVEDPVVIEVRIERETRDDPALEGTVVARRGMEDAGELSRLLPGEEIGAPATRLVELLRRIGGQDDAELVFHHVSAYLLDRFPAARSVVLVQSEPGEVALVLWRGEPTPVPAEEDPPPYPRGLVTQALASGEAMLSTDEGAVDSERSLARVGASAALVVPIRRENKTFGVLAVNGGPGGFQEGELDVAAALAWQVSSAFATTHLVRRLRAVERRLREENRFLRDQVERDGTFGEIIGGSPAIRAVFAQMRLVMETDATVLITGETGTGKELVARALHAKSKRGQRLFAPVNCAALSENLLESELFGHMKGAFTGAHENKKGLFQVAHGGTLFLDEIGELSPKLQVKLLRVLQEGEVTPVGSTRPVQVDVRILCATNRDLRAEVRAGRFREDLFYRVNVFPIRVPALRERPEDIPALAQFFVDRYSKQFQKQVPGVTAPAIERLMAHPFPGNIRELENEMQRAVLLTRDGPVDVQALSEEVRGAAGRAAGRIAQGVSLKETMELLEQDVLRQALEDHGWNRSAAARTLGLSRQALMVKLSKYGMAPE